MTREKIVVLGSMSKMPVAGTVWLTLAYVVGLERLGFEVYYVEAHARTPTMLMELPEDDGSAMAAGFIDSLMRRIDMPGRWAFHALHDDGRVFGLSEHRLRELYRDAACILNIHGGTRPRPEHVATDRLVYIETDPVDLEINLYNGVPEAAELLRCHSAFFTWGTNYGRPDCQVPLPEGVEFRPTLPPVLLDHWALAPLGRRALFTTVANWRQDWRDLTFAGDVYYWSKHREFLKFLDLPRLTEQPFELALSGYEPADRALLEGHGWRLREALRISSDIDTYRRYIVESRGEFTVAKDQNVRLRSGWFSDRTATYLGAGCPAITQDTGFGSALPTGQGLFAFSTMEEILAAVENVNRDHAAHARAAREIAREYLDAERVLGRMVAELGLTCTRSGKRAAVEKSIDGLPLDLELTPVSRWPTVLTPATSERVLARRLPAGSGRPGRDGGPAASVVVVTYENLVFTRLCLESILAAGEETDFELVVVDNGSSDGTPEYLDELARADTRVRLHLGAVNAGFPAAVNRGLAIASGQLIVLLNNDTIVAPGWLTGLARHLDDPRLGLLGAVSNRAATAAQIETSYDTYGGFLELATARARTHAGARTPLTSLTLFCAAMRREVYELVGGLDERFGLGMFEDDDYVMRVRRAGREIACAEDVFVHHFGQAAIGWLARSGAYGALFAENRRRYDEKWATSWRPHDQRSSPTRARMIARARSVVEELVPIEGTVLVVSKGDGELLELGGRAGWHFPQTGGGMYAGFHPIDSEAAIDELARLQARGAGYLLIPHPSMWWLDHYQGLRLHLERAGTLLRSEPDACALYALGAVESERDRRAA